MQQLKISLAMTALVSFAEKRCTSSIITTMKIKEQHHLENDNNKIWISQRNCLVVIFSIFIVSEVGWNGSRAVQHGKLFISDHDKMSHYVFLFLSRRSVLPDGE